MTSRLGHIAVIGAGIGGLRTIEALRRMGYAGRITLIGAEIHLPYDRPPLSKQVLADEWGEDRTFLIDEKGLAELGVQVMLGRRVESLIDNRATLADGSIVDADAFVISTGLVARRLPHQHSRFHTVRGLEDSLELRDQLADAGSVLVVGAGFIGAEVAATAVKRGLAVTMIESSAVPLERSLGREIGGLAARLIREGGVDLRCGATLSAFLDPDVGVGVRLDDGTEFMADVGVVGIGGAPDLDWMTGSGVTVDNGVRCDSTGRAVGVQDVWAVGDAASWHDPEFDGFRRSEHWSSAIEQATTVACSILGEPTNPRPAPYFWSDQFGLKIQVIGHVSRSEEIVELHGDGLSGGPVKGTVLGHLRGDRLVAVTGFGAPRLIARYRGAVAAQLGTAEVREMAGAR